MAPESLEQFEISDERSPAEVAKAYTISREVLGARDLWTQIDALDGKVPKKLVASYHGMPKRYLMQGDPYHCQCQKTTRLLRDRLGWAEDAIDTSFQSVFGREEWLKPYTVEHVADLARRGITDIAVISPAFSADCIETLEEINGEIREAFEHAGGQQFTYVPCLNDDDAHIAVLTAVIAENMAGWA